METSSGETATWNTTSERALAKRFITKFGRYTTFLGFGGIEIGRDWAIGLGAARRHPDEATALATVKAANAAGIITYDTASAYHLSEHRLGLALSASERSGYIINTKVGEHSLAASYPGCKEPAYDKVYCNEPASFYDFSAAAIRQSVEASLAQLQVKTIDTLFLHFGDDAADVLDRGEAVETLKQLRLEGKIRYLGASTDGALAQRCIESGDFDAIELEYNLLNQTNAANIAAAHTRGLGVFVRGGLGTGLLTERVAPYLAEADLPFKQQITSLLKLVDGDHRRLRALALAFLYENAGISSVVVGTRSAAHLSDNIVALNTFSDTATLERVKKLMASYKAKNYTYTVDAYFKAKQPSSVPSSS